jgi:hypothetical protein
VTARVYLPATLALLAEQHAAGSVAVTDDAVLPEGDGEEEEYAALMTAADVSTALQSGPVPDAGSGVRRVVVVVEVAEAPAAGDRVPWRRVVAVHADTEDRPADADPDDDLGWFATQEVPDLLADVRS